MDGPPVVTFPHQKFETVLCLRVGSTPNARYSAAKAVPQASPSLGVPSPSSLIVNHSVLSVGETPNANNPVVFNEGDTYA